MTVVTLYPYTQAVNADDIYPVRSNNILDTAVTVGGGSLSDDSDGSYIEQGAWQDLGGNVDNVFRQETVSADFILPAGMTPVAYLFQMRVKNDLSVLAMGDPSGFRAFEWVTRKADYTDHTDFLDWRSDSNATLGPLLFPPSVTEPTWFTWYWESPDLDNPTGAGGWGEAPAGSDAYTALTETGLRWTWSPFWVGEEPYLERISWLDVYEVRLLVAVEGGTRRVPPLRLFPRSDGRGASSAARVWPRPPTGNYGRVGPGSLV